MIIMALNKKYGSNQGRDQREIFFSPSLLDNGILGFDAVAAERGLTLTQPEWIHWHNYQMTAMPSAADYYALFKELGRIEECGDEDEKLGVNMMTQSLNKDFIRMGLMTSTRLQYAPTSHNSKLNGAIIHHYGSIFPNLEKRITLEIPIFPRIHITDYFRNEECKNYLQRLFGTKDDTSTIAEVLRNISGRQHTNQVYFRTPPPESEFETDRTKSGEQAVAFAAGDNGIFICYTVGVEPYYQGDVKIRDSGRARSREMYVTTPEVSIAILKKLNIAYR